MRRVYKLDIRKTYDDVSWEFLIFTVSRGFGKEIYWNIVMPLLLFLGSCE